MRRAGVGTGLIALACALTISCDDGGSTSGGGAAATSNSSASTSSSASTGSPGDCTNGVVDGAETAVDCGGPACGPCGAGQTCETNADCDTGFCGDNGMMKMVCGPSHCANLVLDADETDLDCGGVGCPNCNFGQTCKESSDCPLPACVMGVCLDHPGCEPLCLNDTPCVSDGDCASSKCEAHTCVPTCPDGVMNANESDVDCGGPVCPDCADSQKCLTAADCSSEICGGGVCQSSCPNGVKSGLETDVDCGGPACPDCAPGKDCVVVSDCLSGECVNGKCGNGVTTFSAGVNGNPPWVLVGFQVYQAPVGTAATSYAEFIATIKAVWPSHKYYPTQVLLGPDPLKVHQPPYDSEVMTGLVAQGYDPGSLFPASALVAPSGIIVSGMIVPTAAAPKGKTSDSSFGPMISTSRFPMAVDTDLLRNNVVVDGAFDTNYPVVDQVLPGQGMQGYSHMLLNFGDNSDLVTAVPGDYQWRIKITDATGANSTAIIHFTVL